ncbi:MAG: hypothetical protein K2X90_04290, partial [Candidatus Babeliaceae bacterium]|nr:hypothetical protein [Candidatus Babeliaceae bacterium]
VFAGHSGWVNSAQFSPDGSRIVSASSDKTVALWDAKTTERLAVFAGHSGWVNSAQFSPDGSRIVSASNDKTVALWDVKTIKKLAVFAGHSNWVRSAQFSPDGSCIVSASDKTIDLWIDIQKVLEKTLVKYQYDLNALKLMYDLFSYKKYLQEYHPKIIQITFAGLAKFLNQKREVKQDYNPIKIENPQKTLTGPELKKIYVDLDLSTRCALQAVFDTHYMKT